MEITISNNENLELVVYDITRVGSVDMPQDIHSITLAVSNASIPNYKVQNLDVLAYLKNNQRDNELYVIDSAVLGLGHMQTIPDGVYHFELVVNDKYTYREKFGFYYGVIKGLDLAVEENEFDIEVTQEGYRFKSIADKNKCDLISISYALYYNLVKYTVKEDEVAINNTLDKLKRILTLIKPDYKF